MEIMVLSAVGFQDISIGDTSLGYAGRKFYTCKLGVLTNDSSASQIEIPCQDIFHVRLKRQKDSFIGHDNHSEEAETGNRRTGLLGSGKQSLSEIKEMDIVEADEFVLGNWKSQGTTSGMFVLDGYEVLFPMVQVGTHHFRWITVTNPSEQPFCHAAHS
jgi:hypothetical protein